MSAPAEERGGALSALLLILLITGAWWALALWPTASVEPDWLARTRAACFGSTRGGLPDAGGWILLVGEPAGMVAALVFGWGRSLRRDLWWIAEYRTGRIALGGFAALAVLGVGSIALRVSSLSAAGASLEKIGAPRRVDTPFPSVALVDQHGRLVTIDLFRGRKALLTFAYAHCTTVCPALVSALAAARREAKRDDVPLLVLTLDPWRDTPDRLPGLAQHWRLGPQDHVLSGAADDIQRALDALGVGRRRSETNGDVDHAAVAMILNEDGRVTWRVDGGAPSIAELVRKL